MRTAGKTDRRLRGARRVKGGAGVPPRGGEERAAFARHEAFRDRLGALDRAVERALAESGASVAGGSWTAEAAEAVLERWAHVARAVEGASPLELLAPPPATADIVADPFGYDPSLEATAAPLLRVLHRAWWRVDVVGLEAIPAHGPVLLVANHAGGPLPYDAAMLKWSVRDLHPSRRLVRPLLDPALLDLPLVGGALAGAGYVADRPRSLSRLLARGAAVAAFPERGDGLGKTYADRHRLGSFGRAGFVRSALRAGAPIVPVAIVGAGETHPALARVAAPLRWLGLRALPITPTFPWLGLLGAVPLPSKWRIEIGEPIAVPARVTADAADDLAAVRQVAADVHARLAALLDRAVAARGHAFL